MSEANTVDCGNRLSIDQAEALYEKLETALLTGGDVVLDGTDVQYSDTAGFQMIISLRKTLESTGNSIRWQAVSENMKEIAGYLGLQQALNLPD